MRVEPATKSTGRNRDFNPLQTDEAVDVEKWVLEEVIPQIFGLCAAIENDSIDILGNIAIVGQLGYTDWIL